MTFAPVFQSLKSDYAFLYFPALAYGYLFIETPPRQLDLYFTSVPSNEFFQVAVLICTIGGLIYHKVFQLIFGDGGPSENPKKTPVVLKHMFMLVIRVDLWDVEDDTIEIIRETTYKTGITNWIPILLFGGPLIGMFILTYAAIPLLYDVVLADGSLIGGVLLVALLITLIQPVVWGRFPNYLPVDSADNIWTPEYVRGAEAAADNQAQKRIDEEWGSN